MLEIRNLNKTFGGLKAINDVSFDINKGDILGLLGPNGAGKTVLVNMITGLLRPGSGRVVFEGEDLVGFRPDQIVKKGVARTFQISTLFFNRTVKENALLGLQRGANISLWEYLINRSSCRRKQDILEQKARKQLDVVELLGFENELAEKLPYGFKKKLAVAMALNSDPKLLLLDEPLTGLNPAEIDEMIALIFKVHDAGITMLLIEHDMRAVMKLCGRIVVINFGTKIAEGSPSEIQRDQKVIDVYLGT